MKVTFRLAYSLFLPPLLVATLFLPIVPHSKASALTIVYSAPTNIITVTGGTETSPIAFDDVYQADLNGELELMANTTAGLNLNLTTQVRPADSKSLRLKLVITGFVSSGHVNITGADIDGNSQTEAFIDITGNGNYTTSEWFSSVDTSGIDCSGSYGIAIYQERWGVVWKFPEVETPFRGVYDYEFRVDCRLQVGDGTTSTWFADESVMVSFVEPFTGTYQRAIDVKAGATFRLGELLDAAAKTSTDGGMLIVVNNYASNYWLIYEDGVAELYSSVFYGFNIKGIGETVYLGMIRLINGKIYNSVLNKAVLELRGGDAYRLTITRHKMEFYSGTVSDVVVSDSVDYSLDLLGAGDRTMKGGKIQRAATSNFRVGAWSWEVANHYLINVEADAWTFTWFREPVQVRVYRQYEFDLKVTKPDGTPIQNANVTIYKYGLGFKKIGSWLTASNGSIPTQTLTMGFYNQTGGNTPYDYNPYNITITHADHETKTFNFTLDSEIDWTIALEKPSVSGYVWDFVTPLAFITPFTLTFVIIARLIWKKERR